MKNTWTTIAILAMAAGLASQWGCDQKDGAYPSSQSQGPSKGDSAPSAQADDFFLDSAAQANLAEVKQGQIAESRSANAEVKKFAKHMIEDHSQANSELLDLAKQKAIPVSQKPDRAHETAAEDLKSLSGAELDRAYVKRMVDDHVSAVALFEKFAEQASDPDIRTFAQKTLPVLRKHLTMARDLNEKVSGPSTP